ncbi:MAG TPA: ABC transporter permease [Gemmatimonadaceae bacterium]|nr:ABC transporter permease [Gemmatimonadaceae bacterium]
MRETWALILASWRTALSYRLSMVFSLIGVLVSVVPVYYLARALQTTMAHKIELQGGEYFAFLLVGMIATAFIMTAVNAIPGVVSSGIATGTLEALLSTRASLPSLVAGLIGYGFVWTSLRSVVMLATGLALGVHLVWGAWLSSLLIMTLIVLAYLPFGLFAASLQLAFRTAGPLPSIVLIASSFLGGVYYPTHIMPSWLPRLSDAIPLTYGLRALRETLLEGIPFRMVIPDVATLFGFVLVLTALSLFALTEALHYARRSGTLAQY